MAMHGSVSRYVAGCKCWDCRIGRSKWDFARRQAIADGKPFSVPAKESAERVKVFLRAGFSYKAIGRPVGMDVGTLTHIVKNPQAIILRSTQERILSIKVSQIEPGYIPVIGITRRMRDLTLMGWTGSEISKVSGVHPNTFRRVLFMHTDMVHRSVAEALKGAFDELSRKTPEDTHWSRTAAKRARARGWERAAKYHNIDRVTPYKWEREEA